MKRTALIAFVLITGLLFTSQAMAAFTTATDTNSWSLLSAAGSDRYEVEVRPGDFLGATGDWEFGIKDVAVSSFTPQVQDNYGFQNGVAVPYSVDLTNGLLTFTLGGKSIQWDTMSAADYFVFGVKTSDTGMYAISMTYDVNGGPSGSLSTDLQIDREFDALTSDMTLNNFFADGEITMMWETLPPRSGLNAFFAMNSLEMNQVPVPAAAWLLGSGLMGLIGLRRRFSKK